MRLQITSAVVVLTLVCGNVAIAQQREAEPRPSAPVRMETQPLRTAVRVFGAESTHLLTRQSARSPLNGKKCLRSIAIATAVVGSLLAAAHASQADEGDKWKVAGAAALRLGVPVGVGVGLAVCTR